MDSEADRQFTVLAGEYLDDRAERRPDLATGLGDHRFDGRLPDASAGALADERRALGRWAARLEALDAGALSAEHRVDAAIMADSLARRVFEIDDLREHTWNPLLANPGKAIYLLLARDFAPLPDRLAAAASRLAEVPGALAEARRQLGRMPRVHLETAIGQFGGTIELVGRQIDAALEDAPSSAPRLGRVRPAALEALAGASSSAASISLLTSAIVPSNCPMAVSRCTRGAGPSCRRASASVRGISASREATDSSRSGSGAKSLASSI